MEYIHYRIKVPSSEGTVNLVPAKLSYSETHLKIAQKEAYEGEYTIVDDGQPKAEVQPSPEDRIAELEEALELLLSGVTE